MNLAIVSLDLLDPLYIAFGWVMKLLYDLTENFGIVIILFTIVLRGLMIPLGINQQKSSIKQQSLQGEIAEIQRAFPNDKQKQSQMQMELYKKHGASPLSGCLPAILQLIIIWPIFRIIQAPLVHVMGVGKDKITEIAAYLGGLKDTAGAPLITEMVQKNAAIDNIPLINALSNNLIVPLLVVLTTLVQMRITRLTMPNRKKRQEDREREKVNPARAGQAPEDKSESMMKSMNVIMPIFMLVTTFSMPASMGLYWIIGNVMMILQSVLIYYLFTRRLEKANQERLPAKEITAART